MKSIRSKAAAHVALILILCGCSPQSEKGRVNGTVTLDGAPLAAGEARFVPTDGRAPAGATIVNGAFSAELPLGTMKVEINAPKVTGKKKMYDTPDSPTVDIVKELLPPRYNTATELTLDVKPGDQEASFPLSSK